MAAPSGGGAPNLDIDTLTMYNLLSRVQDSLSMIQKEVHALNTRVAVLDHRDEEHKRNVDQFWAQTWPRVEKMLQGHEERILQLEKFELAKLDERLSGLEQFRAKALGLSIAIGVFSPLATGLILKYLGS